MKVWVCKICGDEFMSDAFQMKQAIDADGNEIEGLMYVESKNVPKGDDNFVIDTGDNEEEEAGAVEMVNDVVDKFSYTQTEMSASDFKGWMKSFMGTLLEQMKEKDVPVEERKAFRARAQNIAMYFMKNFKDMDIYMGPSFSAESLIFSIYPEGATYPNFYYMLDALKETKF
jgi:hypothetical protein